MKIAIVGATGEVGRMMVSCLDEFQVPVSELALYASNRSAGNTMYFGDQPVKVQALDGQSLLHHYDYVLFSAGAGVARSYAPAATEACEVVIDNSSAFRQDDNIPLIVPEINGEAVSGYSGIIANPNCTTIQLVLPLNILHRLFDLRRVIVSTYQSVSGSGHKGIATLQAQRGGSPDQGIYPQSIDMNVIPQIGAFLDSGYSQEEEKIHFETRKILDLPELEVSATCVRVPVIFGHSESVYAEFAKPVDLALAGRELAAGEAVVFEENTYLTPRELGSSNDSHVSRLRLGTSPNSLTFWNVGHNVRLGAATNAVRILLCHARKAGRL